MADAPMLVLKNVDAGYGSMRALFSASLEIGRGEAVAVVGPNGAGKTTLMRVISGLIPIRGGDILMEGRSLKAVKPHEVVASGIAHVAEHRRLFGRMSVADNLQMGAYTMSARSQFTERLASVYELFPKLYERRNQLTGTMSGGEQQMCAIGRALMSGPKLLLLDEPSAGLAPVIVEQVFGLVRRIRESGLTVLIVEQNIHGVLDLCDRAYLLEAGTIRAGGAARELLASDEIRKAYVGI